MTFVNRGAEPSGYRGAMEGDVDLQPTRTSKPADVEAVLLATVEELSRELRATRSRSPVTLDSSFDQELGFDSLARVELLARVGERFGVDFPEAVLASAETPRDLLRALASARAPRARVPFQPPSTTVEAAAPAPQTAQTLVEVLAWHAARHPHRPHIRLLLEGAADVITYQDLQYESQSIAAGLQRLEILPGQSVALMLPTSRAYFACFFGVLLAGAVPVPIYPPARPSQIEDHVRRHRGILDNALARAIITVPQAQHVARLLRAEVRTLAHVVQPEELQAPRDGFLAPAISPADTAFVQFTSGSTGNPKGVVLSHANLLANLHAMGATLEVTPADVFVSWLPLYHDMGLIGAWFGSLYYAMSLVAMPPLTFLSRPSQWLWAIHHYHATISASPNFGYELCLRRIADSEIEGLDLSSLRMLFNGAEAVSPHTVERFCERFARYGFRREALMPVYGLAENAVGLAFPRLGRGPRIDRIRRDIFTTSQRAAPAAPDDPRALQFVACGHPLAGHEIRIVDGAGRELPEREEGALQFRGPSATSGYLRNPDATKKLFVDHWLDSGDLAYIAEGDVYITGRRKDLIKRAGRNIYTDEIEDAVGNIEGVRKGRVAVFGGLNPANGTERLIVLAETRETAEPVRAKLIADINACVLALAGTTPDDVCLAPPQTVLKTSSGKIRRAASREVYERGLIGAAPRSLAWQLTRLYATAAIPAARRLLARGAALVYAGYAWTVFASLAPVVWALVLLLPTLRQRWALLRAAARLFARAVGVPIHVHGFEHLPPPGRAYVAVANHSSYLDGFALVAALPYAVSFVAKAEFRRSRIVGLFLRRIGAAFVERFDVQRGVADARRLAGTATAGRRLLFFPEGTFTRAPGLLPFHLGAFMVAAEASLPLVPITLHGTRSILRDGSWFPRRGAITLTVARAIEPTALARIGGDTWSLAVMLRDAARREMLKSTHEPDMQDAPPPLAAVAAERKSS